MDAVAFESKSEKKARRKEKQEARERVIEKAKRDYERDQWKKEQAKLRGEDTWMLPALNDRLEQEQKEYEKKAKKVKKEKKKKKKHKKEKKKKKSESNSSSEDSDDSPVWVEKGGSSSKLGSEQLSVNEDRPVIMKGPQLQRDSWMESPLDIIPTISKKEIMEQKKLEEEKQKAEDKSNLLNKPGQHERELNPYWKDGGTGLPENKSKSSIMGGVGDGGLSWMKRAYQRCVEQAKEEKRSLEDVATEKYGSLKKLEKMLSDAEKASVKMKEDQENERRNRFRRPNDEENDSPENRYSSSRRDRSRSRERYRKRSGEWERYKRSRSKERMKKSGAPNDRKFKRPSRSHSRSPERKNDYRSRSPFERNSSRRRERSRSPKYNRKSRSRSPRYSKSFLSSRFKRPGSDEESMNPRDKPKGRFAKPGDFDDDDSLDRKETKFSSKKLDVPAWKKMEYVNVEKKTEERVSERKRKEVTPSSTSGSESESESSESDEPEVETALPIKILTEQEMNQLGAKIVKAEILGDTEKAAKLKAEMDEARELKERNKAPPAAEKNEELGENVVLLTKTDKHGRVRPLPDMSTDGKDMANKRRRKKQKVDTHGKQGERKQYFDDDENFDLKTLVEREKMGTAEDDSLMFARLAGRSVDKTSDDYQIDDVFLDRAAKKQSISVSEMKERSQAIADHKKMAGKLEKCQFCFGNVPKHLIIAIGTKSYLCLPNHKSLTEGHCLIVPMHHTAAGTALDEDVWEEMQVFRKTLVKMFLEDDEDIVFMETSMRLKSYPHMSIECIPLPRELGDMAPIYFKKAIQESEYEWSDNKKLVDLKGRDVRRAIPKGFPYFSVDFGNEGGFAHVIEDEKSFPFFFGREIVGGMLDAEPTLWRKPTRENFDDQRKKVLQFAEKWKSHDWTQKLSKNDNDDD